MSRVEHTFSEISLKVIPYEFLQEGGDVAES